MVISPLEDAISKPETAAVAVGWVQPELKALPFAAFSDTAVLADEARLKPSVTLARTV